MSITNLFAAALLGVAGTALAAPSFTVTVLPAGTYPHGINSSGQVVGALADNGVQHAFLWSGGTAIDLGTLGGAESMATAINRHGHVTGYATTADGHSHAFVYADGVMRDLGSFGGGQVSRGMAINDAGQVAGQYLSGADETGAFVHARGQFRDLGKLGGDFAMASGINAAGQVVGASNLPGGEPFLSHAFLHTHGAMMDLGTLGGSLSAANAVNDAGHIVGNAWVRGSDHAFLYQNGRMTDLGTLGGRRSFAYAINRRGWVVGESDDAAGMERHAFLYVDGAMHDLNALIDPALGWTLHDARAINDRGQIAAFGCRSDVCGGVLLQAARP